MQAVKRLLAYAVCAIGFGCGATVFGSNMKMDPAPKETVSVKGWNIQPMRMAGPGCNCDKGEPCTCDPETCQCALCAIGCKGRGGRGGGGGGDESMMLVSAPMDAIYNVGAVMPVVTDNTTVVRATTAQRYTLVPQTTYQTRCTTNAFGQQQCIQVPVTSYVRVPVQEETPVTDDSGQAPTPQPNFKRPPESPGLPDSTKTAEKTICPCCGMEMTAEQAAKAKAVMNASVAKARATTTVVGSTVGTPVYTSGTTVYSTPMYASDCTTCGTAGTVGAYYGSGAVYSNGGGDNGGGRRGLFRRGGIRKGGGGCCGG